MADPGRYPLLSSVQEAMWGSTRMRFVFEPEPPVLDLVSNVRCACFSGETVTLIETEEFGLSAFPGGLLEPGEGWTHALERELLEEVGLGRSWSRSSDASTSGPGSTLPISHTCRIRSSIRW